MLVILKEDLKLQNMTVILVCIREDHISRRAAKILARMKEILCVGVRDQRNSLLEITVGFIYNALQNSQFS
jgi:hypothetical protein